MEDPIQKFLKESNKVLRTGKEIIRTKNSFTEADNDVMDKIIENIGIDTYGVYLKILSHRNEKNNDCNVGASILSKECNISRITLFRKLKLLEDNGFLIINSGRLGECNSYYFPVEKFYSKYKNDEKQKNAIRKKEVFEKKER